MCLTVTCGGGGCTARDKCERTYQAQAPQDNVIAAANSEFTTMERVCTARGQSAKYCHCVVDELMNGCAEPQYAAKSCAKRFEVVDTETISADESVVR